MLKEQINDDLKQAMRDKNAQVLSVLRMLTSAVKTKEISLRSGEDVTLSDEQILEVVGSEVKKRKDSIEAYEQGNRADLADTEKQEIEILKKYMPEQLSDEELETIVKGAVESLGNVGPTDFGKVMGQIMPQVKGKADGTRVQQIVKKFLS